MGHFQALAHGAVGGLAEIAALGVLQVGPACHQREFDVCDGGACEHAGMFFFGQVGEHQPLPVPGELILAEARRCDYTPSLLAKGLRMKRTNTLGLLIPQVSNPYFADIASAIIREARSHGYTVMVVDTMENEENEQEGIRTMLSRRVDGIVAVPCGRTPDHLEKVNRSVPVMLVDRSFERTSLPYVCTDNYRGGVEATRILLQRGHRRIACIQGVPHSMPNRRRVQGYLDALRQAVSYTHLTLPTTSRV